MRPFWSNRSGNMVVIFALCLLPILAMVGGAIDLSMQRRAESHLQAIADSAALAGASSQTKAKDRIKAARAYYNSHIDKAYFRRIQPRFEVFNDNEVEVEITADFKSSILQVVGIKKMGVNVVSRAAAPNQPIELVLVLDVSGSMRHGLASSVPRIQAAQDASKALIDKLNPNGTSDGFRVGIVPFNVNVNVGTQHAGIVEGATNPLFTGTSWAGCVMERPAPHTHTVDYSAAATGAKGKWRAYIAPPEPNTGGSCLNPSDGTNAGYASIVTNPKGDYTVGTPGPNYNCVRHPVQRLTSSLGTAKGAIDNLTAERNMGTIIAPGVAWGARILSPSGPFKDGKSSTAVRKVMVVLTDGEQTTERWATMPNSCPSATNSTTPYAYKPSSRKLSGKDVKVNGPDDYFTAYGYIKDSDPFKSGPADFDDVADDLHKLSMDACDEAKSAANNIEIYTIAVSDGAGPGTKVHDLLRDCASVPENFYYAADVSKLNEAFEAIGKAVGQVRITK